LVKFKTNREEYDRFEFVEKTKFFISFKTKWENEIRDWDICASYHYVDFESRGPTGSQKIETKEPAIELAAFYLTNYDCDFENSEIFCKFISNGIEQIFSLFDIFQKSCFNHIILIGK